jgi:hypothetical protein
MLSRTADSKVENQALYIPIPVCSPDKNTNPHGSEGPKPWTNRIRWLLLRSIHATDPTRPRPTARHGGLDCIGATSDLATRVPRRRVFTRLFLSRPRKIRDLPLTRNPTPNHAEFVTWASIPPPFSEESSLRDDPPLGHFDLIHPAEREEELH